jgi:hypothetical protein
VIGEINTLLMHLSQTCIMSTMCKLVFFLLNIIYRYCWGTLGLLKGYVLQSISPLQGRNCYAITTHLKTSGYYFQTDFRCIGVLGIPVSSSTLVRGMRAAGFSSL